MKKICYRCLNYDVPKIKKGKGKWKGHKFTVCNKCSCGVFFS
ncbi:MAG: hypothetical protein [Bacteriophage sp.]|nr:MAG: hypothetical protein [Bacteriophage sp.]